MEPIPACSRTDKPTVRTGRTGIITTFSNASANNYGSFAKMTQEMLRQADSDIINIENLTAEYKQNAGLSSACGYGGAANQSNRPTSPAMSPNMKYHQQPSGIDPTITDRGGFDPAQLRPTPFLNQNSSLRPQVPGRLSVTAPIPNRSIKKIVHTVQSMTELMQKAYPAPWSKPPSPPTRPKCPGPCPRPSSPTPLPKYPGRSRSRSPRPIDQLPKRQSPSLSSPGFRGNVNMLTTVHPGADDVPYALKEKPSKTMRRTTMSSDGSKKVVTQEVDIFNPVLDQRSSSRFQPKSSLIESQHSHIFYAPPYDTFPKFNKESTFAPPLPSTFAEPMQRRYPPRQSPQSQPIYTLPHNTSRKPVPKPANVSPAPPQFKQKPSQVMKSKTVSDTGSTRIVSREVRKVFKNDRGCSPMENQKAVAYNKAAMITIIKLFLEIMNQLLKLKSIGV